MSYSIVEKHGGSMEFASTPGAGSVFSVTIPVLTKAPDVVSSDFVGNRHACIVDGGATIVKDRQVVLYVWYDNEYGYACQVVRVVQKWAGISYPLIPNEVEAQGF